MASPGNQHYDNYIGTLSFPIDSLRNIWNHIYFGILLEITAHSDLFFLRYTNTFSYLLVWPLPLLGPLLWTVQSQDAAAGTCMTHVKILYDSPEQYSLSVNCFYPSAFHC